MFQGRKNTMIAGNFSIYRVFIHVVSVIVISCAQLSALSFRAAAYDYADPQIAPPVASGLLMSDIETILNHTGPATPYINAYQEADANNNGLAPLKGGGKWRSSLPVPRSLP